jgi:hypothetical protein
MHTYPPTHSFSFSVIAVYFHIEFLICHIAAEKICYAVWLTSLIFLDLKLLPCCECWILSLGWFPKRKNTVSLIFFSLGLMRDNLYVSVYCRYYLKSRAGCLKNVPYVDNSWKWAGGGFLSTVGDLLRFGNAMMYSYQWRSELVGGFANLNLIWWSFFLIVSFPEMLDAFSFL